MRVDALISIIVPAFNAEDTIEKAVNSILNQTIDIYEIIIVDDGSTDKTPIICDQYAEMNTSIRVIHTENRGVSAARNRGLLESRGEYIGFVDSDDWLKPKMYETLLMTMVEQNADLVACGVIQVTEEGCYADEDDGSIEIIEGVKRYDSILHSQGTRGYLCNKLLKKELITSLLDESIFICEDLLFIADYLKNASRIVYVNNAFYYYVRKQKTDSATYNHKHLTLINAYEQLLLIYQENAVLYSPKVELYTLKIYLNFRARALLIGDNKETLRMLNEGIQKHFIRVMRHTAVPIKQKINVVGTYLFPRLSYKAKVALLEQLHKRGIWES